MKTVQPLSKLLTLCLSLFLFCSGALAQNTYKPDSTGYVNFNLGTSTLKHDTYHQISLYGCNTSIVANGKIGKGNNKGYKWNQANQVLSDVPFGRQVDTATGDTFHISKYYIASPPVFKKASAGVVDSNVRYDIGLVIPDQFILEGEKPVQLVYLDYSVLQPMYIKYIEVVFDSSFQELGVGFVPFKVEASNFPWIPSKNTPGASGATGVGALNRDTTNKGRLFLPYYYTKDAALHQDVDSSQQYLDFQVTILNDILFHYEVFFVVDGVPTKTINLKENQNKKISFHCVYREELPCGCKAPEPLKPYKK